MYLAKAAKEKEAASETFVRNWANTTVTDYSIGRSRGGTPGARPPFAWHPSSLADLGGRARCVPPHLPGILVFDDILGHIV